MCIRDSLKLAEIYIFLLILNLKMIVLSLQGKILNFKNCISFPFLQWFGDVQFFNKARYYFDPNCQWHFAGCVSTLLRHFQNGGYWKFWSYCWWWKSRYFKVCLYYVTYIRAHKNSWSIVANYFKTKGILPLSQILDEIENYRLINPYFYA